MTAVAEAEVTVVVAMNNKNRTTIRRDTRLARKQQRNKRHLNIINISPLSVSYLWAACARV